MTDLDFYIQNSRKEVAESQQLLAEATEASNRLQDEVNEILGRRFRLSNSDLAKHGIKKQAREVDDVPGEQTDYPNGISTFRGEDGSFALVLDSKHVNYKQDKDGNVTVTDKSGKVVATQKIDGTMTVHTEKGTYSEGPDRQLRFEPKQARTANQGGTRSREQAALASQARSSREDAPATIADLPPQKPIVINTEDPLGSLNDEPTDIDYVNQLSKGRTGLYH